MTTSEHGTEVPADLHGILVAWQAGRLTARQTMALCGLDGLDQLYIAAADSRVDFRTALLPQEKLAAAHATVAIRKRLAAEPVKTGARWPSQSRS